MKRALQLAAYGRQYVSPNPMVGCVVVKDQKIIGEGYHRKFGEAHAEVNAIHSVNDQEDLKDSTLYVTLEPCSHHGKTPPCVDLILEKKIPRVVVAAGDPNPDVNGRGIKRLEENGVQVTKGILEKESRDLNSRFNSFHQRRRPYIILKWAQTLDGFIARENYDSKWISNQYSRQLVHRWRAEEDAILVGKNTVKYDNPSLTTRDWAGKDPVKVVLDRNLELPIDQYQVFSKGKTIVINSKKTEQSGNIYFHKIDDNINELSEVLYEHKIMSIIIEGGANTLNNFIAQSFWDEARVFTGDKTFGKGIKAPEITQNPITFEDVKGDRLEIYINENSVR